MLAVAVVVVLVVVVVGMALADAVVLCGCCWCGVVCGYLSHHCVEAHKIKVRCSGVSYSQARAHA